MHMPCTCHAHALHMPCTCHAHAMHMPRTHLVLRAGELCRAVGNVHDAAPHVPHAAELGAHLRRGDTQGRNEH
eukprot:scaffold41527_cov63-Phaeocystis_antarctica.AAC.2